MSFLSRLFGRGAHEAPVEELTGGAGAGRPDADDEPDGPGVDVGADRHAVIAWLRLSHPEFTHAREQTTILALADRVMRELDATGAGTYDTNDLERGFFRMYLYGPDADRLVEVVAPILSAAPPGSYLAKRAGPAGTSQVRIEL